jgi:putative tryptophan/tyrosine transport system substrate-binding protein
MMLRRRWLIAAVAIALSPAKLFAQQPSKVWRVGFLASAGPEGSASLVSEFRDSMAKLGYVEGRNLVIDYRWPKGSFEQDPGVAAALVAAKVDVIVTWPTPATVAAKRATATIPIVFVGLGDPVGTGLVTSLARPGGNLTGISNLARDLTAKQVQLLAQLIPGVKRVGVIGNPANPAVRLQLAEAERTTGQVGMQSHVVHARSAGEFEAAFKRLAADGVAAVLVSPDASVVEHRKKIAELALAYRLPTIFQREENVDAGGLMSYGTSLIDQIRQAALYVDRIFKGAKPADLPVEQSELIRLVLNVKTAKAIGLAIPQAILSRADRVIE